jgi:hypothetical protein
MTKDKAMTMWSDEVPTKADAGDTYYFVRRKDKLDVVIMGFSMGKGWLNGVSYDASEMRNHLFLGPITPDLFAEVVRLKGLLQPIIDCYGLGQSAEKFTEQVGPFILDARAALSSKKE